MSLLLSISPADLGLPERFSSYRPGQAEAIDHILSSDSAITGVNAPTGIGKSLIANTVAKMLRAKAVYLTATKGLQTQVQSDFAGIGMTDVRGRHNYRCRAYTRPSLNCDEGEEKGCRHTHLITCPYTAAYQAACASHLVSTNYAYWLHARASTPNALGEVELLICDEAHEAPEQLASFLRVAIQRDEYKRDGFAEEGSGRMSDQGGARWKLWAASKKSQLGQELGAIQERYKSLAEARDLDPRVSEIEALRKRLARLESMDSNWVWETLAEETVFDPIQVAPYSHLLWSGVPRVLLLSATLRPYTLELLGLDPKACSYAEFDNFWPPQLGPVYYWPTVRLNYESTDEDYHKLVDRIDEIIRARCDRKGVIHTVSYARMHTIRKLSSFAHRMMSNDGSASSVQTVRFFKAAEPPAILLSPSFASGWDFPGPECEYQILPKVPFSPATSRVMQERLSDARYRTYLAMLEVTQMIGRGRRFAEDRCETFLLDTLFPWLLHQARPYAPRRFRVNTINAVPRKPPRAPEMPGKKIMDFELTGTSL